MDEKIIKKVTGIGNGAHIFAPREWINDEVEIRRIPKGNPKDRIMRIIYPYLDKIIAVFLYGSQARREEEAGSDIDVFIISSERFDIKFGGDIIIVPESKINLAKELNPVLFYSMLNEAKPIINSHYLEKLKKEKINSYYLKEFARDTERMININKDFIEMNKSERNKYIDKSDIYSLILRLRGIFIANLILQKEAYSKRKFKDFIIKDSEINYERVYDIYRAVRDGRKTDEKADLTQAESLLELLIRETKKLKERLDNNEKKKEA